MLYRLCCRRRIAVGGGSHLGPGSGSGAPFFLALFILALAVGLLSQKKKKKHWKTCLKSTFKQVFMIHFVSCMLVCYNPHSPLKTNVGILKLVGLWFGVASRTDDRKTCHERE